MEERVEENLTSLGERHPCFAKLLAAFSASHSKLCPRSVNVMSTVIVYIHCIYASSRIEIR
jgi:hypothetical protein